MSYAIFLTWIGPSAKLLNRFGTMLIVFGVLENVALHCFTILHELAHTYFGNVLVVKWWNELAISEGEFMN